jgi:FkbM family methyltransferase
MWDEDAVIAYYTGSLGAAELPLVAYFVRTLDSESVFYDIGSNLGLYAALAEALGARVHSFEPNARTSAYLKMNSHDEGTVNVLALSDQKGTIPFFEVSVGRKIGMSSLFPDVVPQTSEKKPSALEVQALPLDAYVADHALPTVLKIDVMNAEYLVLRGAKGFLASHSPILALRLYRNPEAVERTKETLSLLKELGYGAHSIGGDGSINPVGIVLDELPFASTFIFKKP